MSYRGLFVGIDRYQSNLISELSAAGRDARALHALFADNLGPGGALLVDARATRAAIAEAFERLAATEPDDVVVLAFSGHGSQTHQLITHDADPAALGSTAIALDALADWFSLIPARRLICFLDCCFSGGLGAKVFLGDAVPRSDASTEELLNKLSGEGRVVLTASSATEPAYEHQKLRHGLLTYYVLEGLRGAPGVALEGRTSFYRLVDFVTKKVIAAAEGFGEPQHPALRGQIDGDFGWPVFLAGDVYLKAFPEIGQLVARSDLTSLEALGIPRELVVAWGAAIPSLNELQLSAVNEFGVLAGEHLVVTAPTSSGKTMVGELAALRKVLDGQRAVFLLPLRALVNDKYKQFQRTYAAFGVRTIRATGEVSDDNQALMMGQFDICLFTYEKFAAMALANPHLLAQVGAIVVDEVQMIIDQNRGASLEFLLTFLISRRRQGIEPQLVALSAVIGDANGLDRWMGARLLRRTERPVPLYEGMIRADGSWRYLTPSNQEETRTRIAPQYRKGTSQDLIIPLVRQLVEEGKQVIVFRESKGETRGCAAYLSSALGLPPAAKALERLKVTDPSQASTDLRRSLGGGIGFHNADLEREERAVLEEEFRAANTELRVLVATTTLAMGINTPASAVIVAGLEHPGGGGTPYSVAEYKNIIGRAGRLGFSESGESYVVALNGLEEHQLWNRYVLGAPEDLRSRFLEAGTDPRTLILRVLSAVERVSDRGLDLPGLLGFLESSFGAFLMRRGQESWKWNSDQLAQAVAQLQTHELIQIAADDLYGVTPLGRLAGESGTEVESIIRLAGAFKGLDGPSCSVPTLIAATQLTIELDDVLIPLNMKSVRKEPAAWFGELHARAVATPVVGALHRQDRDGRDGVRRAKRAATCLYWIDGIPIAQIERTITQFGGGFGGAAGPIRAVARRTQDLISTVVRVMEALNPNVELGVVAEDLEVRLQLGIPEQMLPIAAVCGSLLSRGEYLAMASRGMTHPAAVLAAPAEVLSGVLGGPGRVTTVRRLCAEANETMAAAANSDADGAEVASRT